MNLDNIAINNLANNDNINKSIIYGEIEKLITLGLKNLEISWSNNENWLDFIQPQAEFSNN